MLWLFFLKIFDVQEEELEFEMDDYCELILLQYLWCNWVVDDEGIMGDELMEFVNDDLFLVFKNLIVLIDKNLCGFIVCEVFFDVFNYMKNGMLLCQVINKFNEIDFIDFKECYLFGDIYE